MKRHHVYDRSVSKILFLVIPMGFLFDGMVIADEMEICPGVTGIWQSSSDPTPAPVSWRAQWIWMPEEIDSDMMLARRSFDLTERPDQARLRITASSQYQLYINGRYVCRGPARCVPHHQSYDDLEISGLLHPGRNVLAVRVHVRRGVVSYHHQGRPGLLAQLDCFSEGQKQILATNTQWRVHPDPEWDSQAPRISRFHLEVCDRIDYVSRCVDTSGIPNGSYSSMP